MDHPADDVDLAVAASYAHGYVRALIAFTEQLQRTAPPGVHTAAATLAAWILDLDPTTSGSSAPHGCWPTASGASSVPIRRWRRWCGGCLAGLRRPVRTRHPQLCEALAAVCGIIGVIEPTSPTAGVAWRPLDPGRDALLPDLDRELSQAGLVGETSLSSSWTVATRVCFKSGGVS